MYTFKMKVSPNILYNDYGEAFILYPGTYLRKMKSSSIILYKDSEEGFILYLSIYLEKCSLLPFLYNIIPQKATLSDTYPFPFYLRFTY